MKRRPSVAVCTGLISTFADTKNSRPVVGKSSESLRSSGGGNVERLRVSEEIGVATLCLPPGISPEDSAGVDQRLEGCGEVNELGPPMKPITALTRGVWVDGGTVRQK